MDGDRGHALPVQGACIGAACAAERRWHKADTPCRAYRDAERYVGKACGWQRMCAECSESGAQLWTPSVPAGADEAWSQFEPYTSTHRQFGTASSAPLF